MQIPRITSCTDDINPWMTSNRLKLNTQFIFFGMRQQMNNVNCAAITMDGVVIEMSASVTCLDVVIDSELTFTRLVRQCFYDADKTLVQTFITSWEDYCDSVFNSVYHLNSMELVLNAAARQITKKRKFDSISATI